MPAFHTVFYICLNKPPLKRSLHLLLVSFVCFTAFFASCGKQTETIVEKQAVTVHDTVAVHDTVTIPSLISDTVTTFLVVRHAEKETTGSDPSLTTEGYARADELKRILQNVAINKIYSTPYNRTRQTASPLATAKSLGITDYSATVSYPQFINQLVNENKNKTAVVVGHSNTVPDILKAFNSSFNIVIADSQYDNLFLVSAREGHAAQITHLKFGKSTP